jgi:hypothetical protein
LRVTDRIQYVGRLHGEPASKVVAFCLSFGASGVDLLFNAKQADAPD